jgi:hypothetical protein
MVTLSDMFTDGDTRTFQQRRDEVVSLLLEATDLSGDDQNLRRAVHRCRRAHSERQFDRAYASLASAIATAPLCN